MHHHRKIASIMMILITHASLSGCAPSNIRIQTSDKIYSSNKSTRLVAGFKEAEDNRPANEKNYDSSYENPIKFTIGQKLYRDIKLSGLFSEVLNDKFDERDVDVILEPNISHYYYESTPNGWTPVMLLLSITGLPGLIYILAGGPSGDHNAEASVSIKMSDVNGKLLASGAGSKKLNAIANIHNKSSEGIGMIDGRALSDASYDAITSLALNIRYADLPKQREIKSASCESNRDCNGDGTCESGKCASQDIEKKRIE